MYSCVHMNISICHRTQKGPWEGRKRSLKKKCKIEHMLEYMWSKHRKAESLGGGWEERKGISWKGKKALKGMGKGNYQNQNIMTHTYEDAMTKLATWYAILKTDNKEILFSLLVHSFKGHTCSSTKDGHPWPLCLQGWDQPGTRKCNNLLLPEQWMKS